MVTGKGNFDSIHVKFTPKITVKRDVTKERKISIQFNEIQVTPPRLVQARLCRLADERNRNQSQVPVPASINYRKQRHETLPPPSNPKAQIPTSKSTPNHSVPATAPKIKSNRKSNSAIRICLPSLPVSFFFPWRKRGRPLL